MELNEIQKQEVAKWVAEGVSLSDIQKKINTEFNISMTYMDVRLLVIDLNVDTPEEEEPEVADNEEAKEETEPQQEEISGVTVDVDTITRPGAVVSGTVLFSDGTKASWFLDHTGRLASDPLNQMTLGTTTVTPGVTSDPSTRYGDYAQLTIDPVDGKTFWFISEFFTNQGRADQVAVFKFASDFDYDIGVSDITAPVSGILSNNETITINITNFGQQAVSNFPVSYQIDGGNVVTENFNGTIASGAAATYTFSRNHYFR